MPVNAGLVVGALANISNTETNTRFALNLQFGLLYSFTVSAWCLL
jgi:hypothetical protein